MQGHIRKRVHTTKSGRQSVRWYVVVDVPRGADGSRRQKWHGGFGTRREAEGARARIVHDLYRGIYVEPRAMCVSEWVTEHWLAGVRTRVKPSTFDSYERNLRLHVLPRLGSHTLQQVTPSLLNRMYADLLTDGHLKQPGGLSAKTVRYIHTIISKALSDAVDTGLIATNVAERSKPPKPAVRSSTEIRAWTPHQLSRFLATVRGDRLEAAWRLAAMTGMRRGEVLGVRWHDLDLDTARLSVRQSVVSVAYKITISTPKSHQARVIDLDSVTCELLSNHHAEQQIERDDMGKDYHDNDLVFSKHDGTHLHPDSFSDAFKRLRIASQLPRIRLHDLRHTHATIALQAGVPVKVIAERLGHEDPAFTMKQYAHVIPGMQANAARLIADTVDTPTPNNGQNHAHTPTIHTDAAAPTVAAFDTGLT